MINVVDTATHADMLSVRPALPVTLVTLLMLPKLSCQFSCWLVVGGSLGRIQGPAARVPLTGRCTHDGEKLAVSLRAHQPTRAPPASRCTANTVAWSERGDTPGP